MTKVIQARELQVGDVWMNRKVWRVSPSIESVYIEFEDGLDLRLPSDTMMTVIRKEAVRGAA